MFVHFLRGNSAIAPFPFLITEWRTGLIVELAYFLVFPSFLFHPLSMILLLFPFCLLFSVSSRGHTCVATNAVVFYLSTALVQGMMAHSVISIFCSRTGKATKQSLILVLFLSKDAETCDLSFHLSLSVQL